MCCRYTRFQIRTTQLALGSIIPTAHKKEDFIAEVRSLHDKRIVAVSILDEMVVKEFVLVAVVMTGLIFDGARKADCLSTRKGSGKKNGEKIGKSKHRPAMSFYHGSNPYNQFLPWVEATLSKTHTGTIQELPWRPP